jgi:O-antigen/teichoic acid export membrane protein
MSAMTARVRGLLASDFIRHGAIVFVASMTVNVLGYIFHFAISRRLGVVGYGELSALNAAFMLSLVVPQIGSTIAIKYAASFHTVSDTARLATLIRRFVRFTIVGGVGAFVALLLLALPIATFLRVDDPTAVVFTMLMVALSMMSGTLRGLFQGVEAFNNYALSYVLESTLKLACGVGLVYAGYGVAGAFAGWAFGSLAAVAYTVVVLERTLARGAGAKLDLHLGAFVRTLGGVAIATVLLAIMQNADLLVVKHVADPTTAGLYGALSLAGKILLFLVQFVPLIVLPKATRTALAGLPAGGLLLQALAVSAAMSLPGLVFYYFLPRFVITTLAGKAFAGGAPFVFSYGVAMVELALVTVIVNFKMGIHRFDFAWPLGVCALLEVAGIAEFHATLGDVTTVLIAANFLAMISVAWRVWDTMPQGAETGAMFLEETI